MIMELWLLTTALIFTAVGWFMGRSNGVRCGIETTLNIMVNSGAIKIKWIKGEEHLVLPDNTPIVSASDSK